MADLLPRLPARAVASHKGDYGRVLVVAGSRNMSGAAVLCGTAALRGGAGIVTVASPREVQPTIAAGYPSYMTRGFPGNEDGVFSTAAESELLTFVQEFDILAIGPGMGRGKTVTKLVGALLAKTKKPIVLDADGLNALADLSPEVLVERDAPAILTPHAGEFAKLVGKSVESIESQRDGLAKEFANLGKCVVLLKGHRTIVTDGTRLAHNSTGNAGMATGGTGDVLTGIIAALLAQGMTTFDAARLGAHVHGRAGDLAADSLGQVSMTSRDLLDFLPGAFREAV